MFHLNRVTIFFTFLAKAANTAYFRVEEVGQMPAGKNPRVSRLTSSRPEVFCNFIKNEALAQVLYREFCEISKNSFYYRLPLVAASVGGLLRLPSESHQVFFNRFPIKSFGILSFWYEHETERTLHRPKQSPDVFCKKRCSSHQRCSVRKGILRNFAKFTGKHLCQGLIFNKVADLRHRCFPVNFAKSLRTPFFTEHLRWLLLHIGTTVSLKLWLNLCSFK